MTGFNSLQGVELKFARECAADGSSVLLFKQEVCETQLFRTKVLEVFFKSLNDAKGSGEKIDSLTIKNLQDCTSERIYHSKNFQVVRSRLMKLHLQIATESDETAPEYNIDKTGCHQMFTIDLLDHWLKPLQLQSQLTHLTLYTAVCFWRFWPFCDLRRVCFPRLKSLSLGNWTIVHGWQIDWILSHGTLEGT